MTTPTIRLSGPAGLAAAVPSLLGFVPDEGDFVVILFAGKRLMLTARVDNPGHARDGRDLYAELAQSLAATASGGAPTARTVHVVSWQGGVGDSYELLARLMDHGYTGQALTVQGDRVLVEPTLDTTDAYWETLPADDLRPAIIVHTGDVLAGSRADLEVRIAWSGEDNAPAPDNQLVASYGWDLRDVQARDAFLARTARMEAERLAHTLDQLCLVARHTRPGGRRDTVLTVVACLAYLKGDGAMANVALDAVAGELSLARLIRQALHVAAPPAMIREALASV